ncbi:hypothetical protein GCM10025734_77540 [Kitasatospora paranensis]
MPEHRPAHRTVRRRGGALALFPDGLDGPGHVAEPADRFEQVGADPLAELPVGAERGFTSSKAAVSAV